MELLPTFLVTLLGVFAAGLVGFVIRLTWSMRQIEKRAQAGLYDVANIHRLLRGIFVVDLAIIGVGLVLLVLILFSKLPATGFMVAGTLMVICSVAIIPMELARQRLSSGRPTKLS